MSRFSRLVLAFAGVSGFLLIFAAWQIVWPVSASISAETPASATGHPQATAPAGPYSLPPRETYTEIEQRPLFVSGRRPPAAAPSQAAQSNGLDKYAILGIIAAPDRAEAVLKAPTGDTLHLRAGQALEGWTLETIQPRKLVFSSAGQRQEIELKIGRLQPGQTPPRTNNGVILK